MARKASDLMSLLAHRGGGRGRRSRWWQQTVGRLAAWLPQKRSLMSPRRSNMLQAAPVILGCLCLGAGYLIGNWFPMARSAGVGANGLRVEAPDGKREGLVPGPISDELEKLASRGLVTAAYAQREDAARAARSLRDHGLAKARLHQVNDAKTQKNVWVLVVYFDGETELKQFRAALLTVPAPDATFEQSRKTVNSWPLERPIS